MTHVPVYRLLELLAAGASSDELARVPADGALIRLALDIRRTLDEQTRREAQLAALFDTASDLARQTDLDAVLRSIVRRARSLLAVDVSTIYLAASYLGPNDDGLDGAYYRRVTEGSASVLSEKFTMRKGEGLGGLVLETGRPQATRDYMNDARFRHSATHNQGVTDEGLVGLLGVPLKLGGQVIGVVYASDRRERIFSPGEVALLSSLADHAAVAIDNARLNEHSAAALAELESANATIKAHHASIARAQDAHDRLTALVLAGAGVPKVAAAVAAVLEGGIVVYDAEGTELGRAESGRVQYSADVVKSAQTTGRAVSDDNSWTCAAVAGPELLGSITLTGRQWLDDADRLIFERASVVTALLLLLQRSAVEAEDRVRAELITDLLATPGRDPAALIDRGRRLGIDLSNPYSVLTLHAEGVSRARLISVAARRAALAGIVADHVVLLADTDTPGQYASAVADELTRQLDCFVTVGSAGPAMGPVDLAAAHLESVRCLQALLTLGRHGHGAALQDLGFAALVLGDRVDVPAFVRTTLGEVLDYDRTHGSELVNTIRAYFASAGSLRRAGEALNVHVNTVGQRLERIASLLGTDWRLPERALELQLALRLHDLS